MGTRSRLDARIRGYDSLAWTDAFMLVLSAFVAPFTVEAWLAYAFASARRMRLRSLAMNCDLRVFSTFAFASSAFADLDNTRPFTR